MDGGFRHEEARDEGHGGLGPREQGRQLVRIEVAETVEEDGDAPGGFIVRETERRPLVAGPVVVVGGESLDPDPIDRGKEDVLGVPNVVAGQGLANSRPERARAGLMSIVPRGTPTKHVVVDLVAQAVHRQGASDDVGAVTAEGVCGLVLLRQASDDGQLLDVLRHGRQEVADDDPLHRADGADIVLRRHEIAQCCGDDGESGLVAMHAREVGNGLDLEALHELGRDGATGRRLAGIVQRLDESTDESKHGLQRTSLKGLAFVGLLESVGEAGGVTDGLDDRWRGDGTHRIPEIHR